MTTRVVNMKREPYDIDCTRSGQMGLGNPHPIGWCGICRKSHNRRESIEAFRKEFSMALFKREWRDKIKGLQDKVLGCVCKPHACHCDVYAEYLNQTGQYAPENQKTLIVCSLNDHSDKNLDPHRHDPTYLKVKDGTETD